jgi:hypothetical protein
MTPAHCLPPLPTTPSQPIIYHAYDAPNIGPVEFLRAVMHDQSVPLTTRTQVANFLMRLNLIEDSPTDADIKCTYKISPLLN